MSNRTINVLLGVWMFAMGLLTGYSTGKKAADRYYAAQKEVPLSKPDWHVVDEQWMYMKEKGTEVKQPTLSIAKDTHCFIETNSKGDTTRFDCYGLSEKDGKKAADRYFRGRK